MGILVKNLVFSQRITKIMALMPQNNLFFDIMECLNVLKVKLAHFSQQDTLRFFLPGTLRQWETAPEFIKIKINPSKLHQRA
ncbi:MAG: hypothetical protein RIM23_26255 [Coleofasciculus sp. G3-WIS-01]|uniref:hypothetical protein n=1 Tax=Coleofasciculus sp. G3-WIS-01 TaxID=3069528 RepID=UPI003300649B